jgi:alkylation response protein AidB-like acyl-CoA dehydrogenase
MPAVYKAPVEDIRFALFDVLGAKRITRSSASTTPAATPATRCIDEAARFTENVVAPLNAIGDEHGCVYDKATGDVHTPPGFREAYAQFADAGWAGSPARNPPAARTCRNRSARPSRKCSTRRNLAWSNFSLLSHGVIEALKQHGEQWQREAFLRRSSKAAGPARCA